MMLVVLSTLETSSVCSLLKLKGNIETWDSKTVISSHFCVVIFEFNCYLLCNYNPWSTMERLLGCYLLVIIMAVHQSTVSIKLYLRFGMNTHVGVLYSTANL